jgi:predicted amidophosphoribosyltransferase
VAATVVGAGRPAGTPVVVVPVPTTAAAVRARHGDHMWGLAKRAVAQLNRGGWPAAIGRPLAARPRPDSSHLSAADRSAVARNAFRLRAGPAGAVRRAANAGAFLVAVDDVLTTGATLAALAGCLAEQGIRVDAAVTLAATRRRYPNLERTYLATGRDSRPGCG